jgi:hypothetical protein
LLYGCTNLPSVVRVLRQQGHTIESRSITFEEALATVADWATVTLPRDRPTRRYGRMLEYRHVRAP